MCGIDKEPYNNKPPNILPDSITNCSYDDIRKLSETGITLEHKKEQDA